MYCSNVEATFLHKVLLQLNKQNHLVQVHVCE